MAAREKGDAGQSEAQAIADKNDEQGHIGAKNGAFPNEAFSLKSGPDSPSASEQAAKARVSTGERALESTQRGDA